MFPTRFCGVEDTSRDVLSTNKIGAKNICTEIHFSCNFCRQRKMLDRVDVDAFIRLRGKYSVGYNSQMELQGEKKIFKIYFHKYCT